MTRSRREGDLSCATSSGCSEHKVGRGLVLSHEAPARPTKSGWEVRAWGARPVFYPTRAQAVRVARQVLGGTVHRARPPAPVAAVVKHVAPSLAVNLRGWSHTLGGTR